LPPDSCCSAVLCDTIFHLLLDVTDGAAPTLFSPSISPNPTLFSGANQGIGYATAKQMASQKAHVHMVCRSKERGEAALAKLRSEISEDGRA